MKSNDPQHYFLIAGKVMFRDPDMPDAIGNISLNVTSRTKTRNFTAKEIGRAQQALQMQAFQKLGDPKIEMVDVCILNVSYLGHMTESQFMKDMDEKSLQARGEKPN